MKQKGLVDRGGGHAAAFGVAVHTGQIEQLRAAAITLPMSQVPGYEPAYEVAGEIEELSDSEWHQVCEAIEPSGHGNPAPLISARHACLLQPPKELRTGQSGKTWAYKGDFLAGRRTLSVIWTDLDRAIKRWRKGGHYHLHLELSPRGDKGRIYMNWLTVRCERAE